MGNVTDKKMPNGIGFMGQLWLIRAVKHEQKHRLSILLRRIQAVIFACFVYMAWKTMSLNERKNNEHNSNKQIWPEHCTMTTVWVLRKTLT